MNINKEERPMSAIATDNFENEEVGIVEEGDIVAKDVENGWELFVIEEDDSAHWLAARVDDKLTVEQVVAAYCRLVQVEVKDAKVTRAADLDHLWFYHVDGTFNAREALGKLLPASKVPAGEVAVVASTEW